MRDAKNGGYGTITRSEAFEKFFQCSHSKLSIDDFDLVLPNSMAYIEKAGITVSSLTFNLSVRQAFFFQKAPEPKTWYGTSLPGFRSLRVKLKISLHTPRAIYMQ